MLGKLLKHEFRATGRIMLPLFALLFVMSLGANFAVRIMDSSNSNFLNLLAGLIMTGFVIAIIGVSIMSGVLMIQRFYRNFLSDEGYLMFTLPASVYALVLSKIIVSSVWFIATLLADILAGLIATFRVDFALHFFRGIPAVLEQITSYYALNGTAIFIELMVLFFLGCASICLLFYASMAIGHSFANHKNLISVAMFFGIQFLLQTLASLGILGSYNINLDFFATANPMTMVHAAMAIAIGIMVIYCAGFYFVTTYMLRRHLNLE